MESVSPQASLLDAERFGRIYREYADRLIGSITGFLRDRGKAEEIAARAFEKAWERREDFRGEASPTTWIEAIARNEARNAHRSGRKPMESIEKGHAADLPSSERVTDSLERREDRLRLLQALSQLPGKHRRALTDHFMEGLSVREIAQRERIPVGTALSRIHTGKQLLREAWESQVTSQTIGGQSRILRESGVEDPTSTRDRPDATVDTSLSW